jgi:hypothetical protein
MTAIDTRAYESHLRPQRHTSGINVGRIITGGILAGFIFTVLDFFTNGVQLGAENTANAARLGLGAAAFGPAVIASLVGADFLGGILVVFIYASIRPRFGPGPKTALIAGLLLYLNVCFVMFVLAQSGISTMRLFWETAVLQLITVFAGALAGAWVYREP